MAKRYILKYRFKFDSAHFLPFPYQGQCSVVHGHTYHSELRFEFRELDENGMVMDFKVVKELTKKHILADLDHRFINEIITKPTCENIASWIYDTIRDSFPEELAARLVEVEVWETEQFGIAFRVDIVEGELE